MPRMKIRNFPDSYTFITEDSELKNAAKRYVQHQLNRVTVVLT